MMAVATGTTAVVPRCPLRSTILINVNDGHGSSLRDDVCLVFDDRHTLGMMMLDDPVWHCRGRQGQGERGNDAGLHGAEDFVKG